MTDNKTIEEIINTHNFRIKKIIRGFFRSADDVEDIEQEVYIKTWINLPSQQENFNLLGWIKTVTLNTCKDKLKYNQRRPVIFSDENHEILNNIPDNASNIESKALSFQRQQLILSSVNRLSPKLREIVILFDIEELTLDEISKKLKCPVGTVKSRLFNARKQLKEDLKEFLD